VSEPKFLDELKFDANGLIPVVIQDANTGEVLTVAYMNRDAVRLTFETGKTWFWRRRHQKLMMKGEHSGRVQVVKEILVDCDADALVVKVEQVGGAACHEGYPSCFFRKVTRTANWRFSSNESLTRTRSTAKKVAGDERL